MHIFIYQNHINRLSGVYFTLGAVSTYSHHKALISNIPQWTRRSVHEYLVWITDWLTDWLTGVSVCVCVCVCVYVISATGYWSKRAKVALLCHWLFKVNIDPVHDSNKRPVAKIPPTRRSFTRPPYSHVNWRHICSTHTHTHTRGLTTNTDQLKVDQYSLLFDYELGCV